MSNSNILLSEDYEHSFETQNNQFYEQKLAIKSSSSLQQEKEKKTEKSKQFNSKFKDITSKLKISSKVTISSEFTKLVQQLQQKSFKEDQDTLDQSFDEKKIFDINEEKFKKALDINMKQLQLKRQQLKEFIEGEDQQKQQQEALLKEMKKKTSQKEEIDTTSNECIAKYSDYVNGMIGPLVLPIIVSQCWIFYNQNNLANDYNIAQDSYIYYFLFSVMIIPFRIAIDIVYFHIWMVYHDIDFSIYAEKAKKRFENRRQIWKALQTTSESEEGDIENGEKSFNSEDKEEEEEVKDLNKWCFSSQYYFVQSFFLIGMMQVVIGIYGVTSSKYNCFGDKMVVPIIIIWYIVCVFVHKFCLIAGKYIGVWRVKKQNITTTEQTKQDETLSDRDQQPQTYTEDYKYTADVLKKRHIQLVAQNLAETQFENANFRKTFVQQNKIWLKNNLRNILDKETKQKYRDIILEEMEGIDVRLKQKRNLKRYLFMKKINAIRKQTYLDDELVDEKDKNSKKKERNKHSQGSIKYDEQDFDESLHLFEEAELIQSVHRNDEFNQIKASIKPTIINQISYQTKIILKYWLYRSRNYKKACKLIGGLVDRSIKKHCLYCGETWGLICTPKQNIEDTFLNYLKKVNLKNVFSNKQKDSWQDYFRENSELVTICLSCNNQLQDEFVRQKIAERIKIPSLKQGFSRILDNNMLLADVLFNNQFTQKNDITNNSQQIESSFEDDEELQEINKNIERNQYLQNNTYQNEIPQLDDFDNTDQYKVSQSLIINQQPARNRKYSLFKFRQKSNNISQNNSKQQSLNIITQTHSRVNTILSQQTDSNNLNIPFLGNQNTTENQELNFTQFDLYSNGNNTPKLKQIASRKSSLSHLDTVNQIYSNQPSQNFLKPIKQNINNQLKFNEDNLEENQEAEQSMIDTERGFFQNYQEQDTARSKNKQRQQKNKFQANNNKKNTKKQNNQQDLYTENL